MNFQAVAFGVTATLTACFLWSLSRWHQRVEHLESLIRDVNIKSYGLSERLANAERKLTLMEAKASERYSAIRRRLRHLETFKENAE